MRDPLILDFGAGLLAVRAEPLGQDGWLRVFRLAQPQAPWAHAGVDADAHPDGHQALGDAPDCGEEALRLIFSDHASLSVVLERLQRLSRSFLWKCSACGTALDAAGRRCAPCAAADSERCAEAGSAAWMRAAHRRFVAGLDDALPTPAERVEIAEAAAKYWRSAAESWRRKAEARRTRADELLEVAARERDEAQQLAARRYDCAGAACGGCMTCLAMDDEERERLTRERDEARAALQEALADPPEGPDLRVEVWARRRGKVRSCALKTFPTHEERGALRDHFRRAAQDLEAELDAMDRGEWRQVFTGDGDETPPARLVRATVEPGGA